MGKEKGKRLTLPLLFQFIILLHCCICISISPSGGVAAADGGDGDGDDNAMSDLAHSLTNLPYDWQPQFLQMVRRHLRCRPDHRHQPAPAIHLRPPHRFHQPALLLRSSSLHLNQISGPLPSFGGSISQGSSLSDDDEDDHPGCSATFLAGVVVGAVISVLVHGCCVAGFLHCRQRKKKHRKQFKPITRQSPPKQLPDDEIKVGILQGANGARNELFSQIPIVELRRATYDFSDAKITGTLGQHLFDEDSDRYCALNWRHRLVIALDVARGVEYLHGLALESFIHGDLKPSNILLGNDLRAKVSDFGLAKLADKEKSTTTRLAGTFGYLAPEHWFCHQLRL